MVAHAMRYFFGLLLPALLGLTFTGCSDQPETQVRATPVGSVLTGETRDPDDYLEQVEAGNKARQQEQQYKSAFDREEPGATALQRRY